MKKTFFLYYSIIFCLCGNAQTNEMCIKKILMESPNLSLPVYLKKDNNLNYKEFNEEIISCALFNKGKSKLFYQFTYYDNDLMKNVKEIRKYYFRILGSYKKNNIYILIYEKGGNDSLQTYLLTFINEILIDEIVVGFEEGGGDTEMMKYKESIITENLEIKTRYYEWNPEYIDKKTRKNPNTPKTIVTLTDYKIDENSGKILLIKQEKKYSNCIPEEFSYPEDSCNIFDKP